MSARAACAPPIAVLVVALVAGCAAGRVVTRYVAYSNPQELVGTWVDSALASPRDTVAWVLGTRGLDQTLTLHLRESGGDSARWIARVDGYGYWYVSGGAQHADSGRICFRSRARGRDACYQYQISTLPVPAGGAPRRRRIIIVGYQGRHHTRDRVLYERLPKAPAG